MTDSDSLAAPTTTGPPSALLSASLPITTVLSELLRGFDGATYRLPTGEIVLTLEIATTARLGPGGTLKKTHPAHILRGDGKAVRLSEEIAIADGTKEGEVLFLLGDDSFESVTIPNGANTNFNGDATFEAGRALVAMWDKVMSEWRELFRNF